MHLLSFLRGMAFGGILVYLFAPRSGAETRQMLAQRGNDLKKLLADDVLDLTSGTETASSSVITTPGNTIKETSGNIYDPATLKPL